MNAQAVEGRYEGSLREREIVDARLIRSGDGSRFLTLQITTASGVRGLGDATLAGWDGAVAACLRDRMLPCLLGRDAGCIEETWRCLRQDMPPCPGTVLMCALAAIDVALWDIRGKMAALPLHRLLGGRARHGVRVFAHAAGRDVAETSDQVALRREQGFAAVAVECELPDMKRVRKAPPGSTQAQPHDATSQPSDGRVRQYLDLVPELFDTLRHDHGNALDVLHDMQERLWPMDALRLARSIERYRPFWLGNATGVDNADALALIRAHGAAPLAAGQGLGTPHDWRRLIESRGVDFLRLSIADAGGITLLRHVADLAAMHGVRMALHSDARQSPITHATTLQFNAWVPNFGIQAFVPHSGPDADVFRHEHQLRDGHLYVSNAPGHGVEMDGLPASKHSSSMTHGASAGLR